MQHDEDKKMPGKGDRVRYDWQGATVRGRVESVETEGTIRDSTGEATMDATADNPVYRVRLVDDDGEATDQIVLRRGDALTMDDTRMDEDDDLEADTDMYDEDKSRKGLGHVIRDELRRLLGIQRPRTPTGLKVQGNRWVAVWSNNFEDREREVFSQKAHDDYVARVDTWLTPPPELWVWHIPGSRIGQAQWVGRHGHFMLAGGAFDDTEAGRKAAQYYRTHGPTTALSHGFTYPANSFDGTVYRAYNTFEISLLPRGKEANRYTTLKGVQNMSLSEEKRQHLEKVFGDEAAAQLLADLDAAGKALEDAEVAYKDFATLDDGDEAEVVRDAAKAVDATGLLGDVLAGHADVAEGQAKAATEIAAHTTRLKAIEAQLKALHEAVAGRPRSASQDAATIDTGDVATQVAADIKQQTTKTHPFWGTQVTEEGD